jgi:hypothetical protein
MKTRIGFVSVVAGMLVLLATLLLAGRENRVQAAPGVCSASTIKGTYGFALDGLVSGSFHGDAQKIAEFFPLAAAGTFSFDGHGNASRAFTVSFGGQISPASDSGPYTVNPDCTGSATFTDGNWNFAIAENGSQINAINATPGILVEGVLNRTIRTSETH